MSRFWQRINSKKDEAEFALLQLVSLRRIYLEGKDRSKLRKLAVQEDRFHLSKAQIKAAASRAKETLVVAGAGSGKTSLIVGRALWLIHSKRVPSDEILLLAFNKAAAEEIQNRTKALNVEVKAKTFHSFGLEILSREGNRLDIDFTDDYKIEKLIRDTLTKNAASEDLKLLAKYFAYQMVPQKKTEDFKNLNEYSAYIKATVPKTLRGENVKSHGEWIIANLLYVNGIDYEYEAMYQTTDGQDRHKPDFTVKTLDGRKIYIEYFGIDRHKNTAPWINKEKYNQSIKWKEGVHRKNGTRLISLFYYNLVEGKLKNNLIKELRFESVPLKPRSAEEVLDQANSIGYTTKFFDICSTFLRHVRAQRLSHDELVSGANENPRSLAFLQIFKLVQEAYENVLRAQNKIDYTDLIHQAADLIEQEGMTTKFSHLLVDEFQDISFDRNRIIESLRKDNPKLEVTAVGDDWQSIYRFTGSDIEIMKQASLPAKNRKRVNLEETYRLPQGIADIARDFILANPSQLEKSVFSKTVSEDGSVFTHWDTEQRAVLSNVEKVIEFIGTPSTDPSKSLMVLARYKSNLPQYSEVEKLWEGPIELHTIHSAKGLEADYVIVTDLVQDFRGFPSTIQDDEVFKVILSEDETYPHAEERRLFYVAITRARKDTHLICPNSAPSEFCIELFEKQLGVHIGRASMQDMCPVCKSGVILKSKAGSSSYCSNIPICEFQVARCPSCESPMLFTPDENSRYTCINHPEQSLRACPACSWGLLVDRTNSYTGEKFSGCHTFSVSGCNAKVPYMMPSSIRNRK